MMNQTQKHTTGKKLLALLLALIMTVSLLPVSVFAAEVEAEPEQNIEQSTEPAEEDVTVEPSADGQDEDEAAEEPAADPAETVAAPQAMVKEVAAVYAATDAGTVTARDTSNDGFIRIFHLDCGRKFFSVSEIEGIIDQLAANHYTHIQLAFGNNGFRFLLNDLEVTVDTTTYSSQEVTDAIKAGNSTYSSSKSADSTVLTESEMDSIIEYAQGKGISVIPMLNTPGHMDALVSAMKTLGIRTSTGSEMSLTSASEVNFIKALQQKYITYFASKGSDHYNLAADEYSFSGLSDTEYTAFAQYVNDVAAMIKSAGMTPMAYNDGIYYSGKTSSVAFDTDIQICYWAQAEGYASVTELASKGFTIINNNDAWYYVLGDYLYQIWATGQWGYEDALQGIQDTPVTQTKNGDVMPAGSVLCCWCDGPSVVYSTYQTSVYNLIKAMADANPDYFKADTSDTPAEVELPAEDTTTLVDVVVKGLEGQTATVTVEAIESRTEGLPEGAQAVSYNVTPAVNGTAYTSEGTVTLPVPSEWVNSSDRIRGYIVTDGNVETITGTYDAVSGKYTFSVLHFSEMGLLLLADSSVEVTEAETITVTVGQTATDTISGANYAGTYTTDDPSIATVEVTGKDATEATTTYTQASVTCNTLISSNANNWTAASGYYYTPDGTNYYPVYAKRFSSWSWAGRTYTYTWGYSTDSGSTVTQIGTQETTSTRTAPNITVYTKSGTEGTPASTTVTFTGVAVGTTYVTVGNTRYTINVVEEDLSDAATLPIQLWITNYSFSVTGVTNQTTGEFNDYNNGGHAYYVSAKAEDAYGEEGVPLSDLVPVAVKNNTVTTMDDRDATYTIWKGTVLNRITGLQKVWSKDMTMAEGRVDYQYVRYFGGAWSVSADRVNWTTVTGAGSTGSSSGCTEQVIAYYMQRTDVTTEVITEVVDWGITTDEWADNDPTQYVVLDFAVQYPDRRVPDTFPVEGKTVYFHCDEEDLTGAVSQDADSNYYRRIGLIKATDTTGYEVYMVTVTPTSDTVTDQITNSYTALTTNTTIEYNGTEKVAWVDDEANLPANFQSDDAKFHSISGSFNYTVGGEANLAGLEIYQRQGMLVTYYLRAKVNKDTLHVHYIDQAANQQFYGYDINVNEGTFFKEGIGLNNPDWKGPLVNGDVVNDQNITQTVSADLSTMPAIGAQYRYSDYECVEVSRSDDKKDVYLYYTFTAEKTFVVDFGLPLNIKPSDVSANLDGANITGVVCGNSYYATVTVEDDKSISYTLVNTINGEDRITVTYTGTNINTSTDGSVTFNLTIIPASTVYYEDSFVTFTNGVDAADGASWTTDGDASTTSATQALEELGKHTNVYGYDTAYANSTTFSMGSARKVTVTKAMAENWRDGSAWPTATFTFKGTGFDIISLTDNTSGVITCEVKNSKGESVNSTFINNYYGYKYENGEFTEAKNGDNKLYQLPVIKVSELEYDTYTVTLTAAYGAFFDMTGDDQYTFWLDAIRVYDPMGPNKEIYNTDSEKEGYPKYIELRNALAETPDGYRAVLIEGTVSAEQIAYKNYGPNHEVYLAKDQTLAFQLSGDLSDIATVQLGLKAVDGAATYTINSGEEKTVGTATDMYYEITDAAKSGDTVLITNIGETILSLTNIKVTFTASDKNVTLALMGEEAVDHAVLMVRALFAAAPVEPEPEPTFAPERFEAAWNRSTVRAGQKATLTVKTSEDVEAVMVDGVTIDTYRTRTQRTGWGQNATKVTYREFTYTITAAETADYSITAVNAEGIASEPITATLTVQAASQRPSFGGWLDKIFGHWF